MILSTTPQIEGHTIREYKGIVTGENLSHFCAIVSKSKDVFTGCSEINRF